MFAELVLSQGPPYLIGGVAVIIAILSYRSASRVQTRADIRQAQLDEVSAAVGELAIQRTRNDRLEQDTLDLHVKLEDARAKCADDYSRLDATVSQLRTDNEAMRNLVLDAISRVSKETLSAVLKENGIEGGER